MKTKFTPPEVARRWGIGPDKIVGWIRRGELRAINVATRRGGRPRYLIDEKDLADFEMRRAVIAPPPGRRNKRQVPKEVIQFF